MPEAIEVGNEANVMFSIYNVGKTKLYNVSVKFEADSICGGDTFIGNMDPGATGNVDAYLAGQAATMDDGTVKIIISYEDEEGKTAIITGDTLFSSSFGRTDLYGGNIHMLKESIQRLAMLDRAARIYPGHNESSTLGDAVDIALKYLSFNID